MKNFLTTILCGLMLVGTSYGATISSLPAKATLDNADPFLIDDVAANVTKKVLWSTIQSSLVAAAVSSSAITNTALASGQVAYADPNGKMIGSGNLTFLADVLLATAEVAIEGANSSLTIRNPTASSGSTIFRGTNFVTFNSTAIANTDAFYWLFTGADSLSNVDSYAKFGMQIQDNTSGSEDGAFIMRLRTGGASMSAVGWDYRFSSTKMESKVPIGVPDDAYAAGWDGSTNVPTKNALYDKIETLSSSGGTTNMMVAALAPNTTVAPTFAIGGLSTVASAPRRLTIRVAMTNNVTTVSAPAGTLIDGDVMVLEFIQDAVGSRTITGWDAVYAFGTDITGITLTTTASKRDFATFVYNSTATKWYACGFVRGY